MKGDNIIEAYCELCGRPITAADIAMEYQIMMEGKPVHLHHDPAVIKALENPDIALAIAEVLEYTIVNQNNFTPTDLYHLMVDKSLTLGLEEPDLRRYLNGAMCRTKYAASKMDKEKHESE